MLLNLGGKKMETSTALGSIVTGVVLLFVGIFMISAVSDTFAVSSLYNTRDVSDTDNILLGSANVYNHTFATNTVARDGTGTLYVRAINISNANDRNLELLLDSVYLSNQTGPISNVTTTLYTVTDVPISSSTTHAITYRYTGTGNITIYNATLRYYDTAELTNTGTIYNNTVSTTGTAFTILGLVLIVVGLAMAINSLKSTQ